MLANYLQDSLKLGKYYQLWQLAYILSNQTNIPGKRFQHDDQT